MGCSRLYEIVENKLGGVFENYGKFVARYPVAFIISALVICCGLGIGLLLIEDETDLETLYVPSGSRSVADRQRVMQIFPDVSAYNYSQRFLSNVDMHGDLLIRAKNGRNVLSEDIIQEIRVILSRLKTFEVHKDDNVFNYQRACAQQFGECVVDGELILDEDFLKLYRQRQISFPVWKQNRQNSVDLFRFLGNVDTVNGSLSSAKTMRIIFHLRQDSTIEKSQSSAWEIAFLDEVAKLNTNLTEVVYSTSQSLAIELNLNTKKDIRMFSYSFTLMMIYATFAASGGNCVANRGHLARAAVVAVLLSILASFGTLSIMGLKFVNIVGVMPFLVIGVGVDYSFVLMSGWVETYICQRNTIEERIGMVFRTSGISVTIAALTDIIAFAVGAMSDFMCVRHFCIYTGVALLFCYLCHMTFFAGCLVIHARRVHANRHCVTCVVKKTPDEMRNDGAGPVKVWCCSGFAPKVREQDESGCDVITRVFFTRILLKPVVKVFVILIFMTYFIFAIWGVLNLKQGLILSDLVSEDSYYNDYSKWFRNNFQTSFAVSFIVDGGTDFSNEDTVQLFEQFMNNVDEVQYIRRNGSVCWLDSFLASDLYNNTSNKYFMGSLHKFLDYYPQFINDVKFNDEGNKILQSRCYAFTDNIPDSSDQGTLMKDLRELSDESSISVFAFSPYFIYFEQYNAIIPNTVQIVGAAIGAMLLITVIFMPHPLMVTLVILNLLMILTGIFGFMYYWDLTLSSITMIHLIMSIGFSVDYSVHICHGYLTSTGSSRHARTCATIAKASSPIWNAGMSSLIGICTLVASESYVFLSFFKVMVLVIAFGILHAALLLPVVLSLIGPMQKVAFANKLPIYSQPSTKPNEVINPTFESEN